MDEDIIDASEAVLARLDDDDDVAYAEVGGVTRHVSDVVATIDRVRSATDSTDTGVWWRVFADGAADYRYATILDDDHLDDLVERSIRSAKLLDQSQPAHYDWGTVHRALHPGWASGDGAPAATADEAAERVRDALADALSELTVDRARSTYRGERVESTVTTTTGTAVSTTVDRRSAETVVVPAGGPKLRDHAGATAGGFVDSLDERFDALAARARSVVDAERTTLDASGTADVVLGPLATGSLIHQLSHYLEIDAVYLGASPFAVGDRIAPDALSIADVIRPGSWAARAYDAEGRPTQSVSLVSEGAVTNHLYNVPAAIEEDAFPAGHAIPSLGYEDPPRVHARHLDVAPGRATETELREGADLYVERFGEPRIHNEATRTKRRSAMPPSVLYARDIATATPSEFAGERTDQRIHFPIAEARVLRDGDLAELVTDGTVTFSLADLETVSGLGIARRTLTGTCEKHRSHLPFAVTAPAMALSTTVRSS